MQKDRDSTSTQSTGQSNGEVGSDEGHNESSNQLTSESTLQVISHQPPDFLYNVPQSDGFQQVVQIPYAYADAYFGQMMIAYGPQINSQMYDSPRARVPLPDLAEDEPIYVNAKQFRAILRRRASRAKLEAQNKMLKSRKPYLHESRHRHAVNRVRGSGGRFVTTNKPQEPKITALTQEQKDASSTNVRLSLENRSTMASSITSSSDITCGSDGSGDCGVFDTRSTTYPSRGGVSLRNGGLHNGSFPH